MKKMLIGVSVAFLLFFVASASISPVSAADNCENCVTENQFLSLVENFEAFKENVRDNYVRIENFEDLKENLRENYVSEENIRDNFVRKEVVEDLRENIKENFVRKEVVASLSDNVADIEGDYVTESELSGAIGDSESSLRDSINSKASEIYENMKTVERKAEAGPPLSLYLVMLGFGLLGGFLWFVLIPEGKSSEGV